MTVSDERHQMAKLYLSVGRPKLTTTFSNKKADVSPTHPPHPRPFEKQSGNEGSMVSYLKPF